MRVLVSEPKVQDEPSMPNRAARKLRCELRVELETCNPPRQLYHSLACLLPSLLSSQADVARRGGVCVAPLSLFNAHSTWHPASGSSSPGPAPTIRGASGIWPKEDVNKALS